MLDQVEHIYQSGERVTIAGTYAVVGVNLDLEIRRESPIREFQVGDHFPNFQGFEVAWRLAGQTPSQAARYEPLTPLPL